MTALNRHARIVRAAEALIASWKTAHPDPLWHHRGHWYPMGCQKQAKALINAVLAKGKK